ncbi:MAG: ABC transporter substrate-binding protein [Thermoplasmata archaeon]
MDFKNNKSILIGAVVVILLIASFVGGFYTYKLTTSNNTTQTGNKTGLVNSTNTTITIVDDTGRLVTIQKYPQRIVSLAPSNTEILYNLGLRSKIVGVDSKYDYTNQQWYQFNLNNTTQVTNSTTINYELIVSLRPSLVLAAGITSAAQVEKMSSLGLTVVVLNPYTMHQIINDVSLVGLITGQTSIAQKIATNLTNILNNIENKMAFAMSRPSVLLTYFPDSNGYWTYGAGTFGGRLIDDAGGFNAANNQTSQYPEISQEGLMVLNPEYILVGVGPYGLNVSSYSSINPLWGNLSAVKGNTVYTLNDAYISEPDITLFSILQEIAYILHPELFNLTGNMTGEVMNGSTPVSNISVTIITAKGNFTAQTNSKGIFIFKNIPAGPATIDISYQGKIYNYPENVIYLNMGYVTISV